MDKPLTPLERSKIYYWLSRVFRSEISLDFLDTILDNKALLQNVGFELDEVFFSTEKESLLEQLAIEYTRLFLGPGSHISLVESVHRPECGTFWGESTSEVVKFFSHYGLSPAADNREFPDHLSLCLEFMGKLTEFEQTASDEKRQPEANQCLAAQKLFFTQHIHNWVPHLCELIITKAALSFYRESSRMTQQFIQSEAEFFNTIQYP
ncbi:molecular chaperone TorD family protein [Deltaproteobacteria bacterium TL4]